MDKKRAIILIDGKMALPKELLTEIATKNVVHDAYDHEVVKHYGRKKYVKADSKKYSKKRRFRNYQKDK
ncbi:hypothetical protein [uncultured Arcobacter sp.]|uniref:hypothetical protein n=1 Tax=uncultured Arcobacter sp. TaxID=165434 RepID=UPI0026240CBE|nr:hypothetical protein [uncultured Arcobacter sp.]